MRECPYKTEYRTNLIVGYSIAAVSIIINYYITYYVQYKYFANIKDKQSYIHLYNELKPYISEIKSCFTNLNLLFWIND